MTHELIVGLTVSQIREKDKRDLIRYASQKKHSISNRIAKISDFYKECFKSTATRV